MVEISCFDRGGISCSSLTLFLDGEPAIDLGMQDIQGQGTAADDLVVKGAKIEFVAQLLASFLAQAQNFQLPQLVRQSVVAGSPRVVAISGSDRDSYCHSSPSNDRNWVRGLSSFAGALPAAGAFWARDAIPDDTVRPGEPQRDR